MTASAGRIAVDVGRFSPVDRVVRVPLPGRHERRRIAETVSERRGRAPRGADGCERIVTRATEVTGSVRRLH